MRISNVLFFLFSFFLSLYTAINLHEDYVQMDCILLARYKSVRKKNRKDDRVKKTVQELKNRLQTDL